MKKIINESLGAVHTHTHTRSLLKNKKIKANKKCNSSIKPVSILDTG